MKFGKFLKKAVRLGAKIATPLLAATPVGAIALRAQQTLKSLGGNLKAARLGKIQPLSVRAPVEKIAAAGPAKRLSRPFPVARRARTSSNGSRMPQKRRTAGTAGPSTGGKRPLSPSKLKAQAKSRAKYAAWKAAGKPGVFFEWAKANR